LLGAYHNKLKRLLNITHDIEKQSEKVARFTKFCPSMRGHFQILHKATNYLLIIILERNRRSTKKFFFPIFCWPQKALFQKTNDGSDTPSSLSADLSCMA
jgi:hypothetical protein